MMKVFIDTANLKQIERFNALGIVDGVTTNPSLIAKEGADFDSVVGKICTVVKGPVSLEVISQDAEGMVDEALKLVEISPNVVIKIPLTEQGLIATKILSSQGVKVNATLIFSASQAFLAAKAGAAYVSPFVGRLDDIGHDGMQVVRDIVEIFRNYDIKTEIIVASIRHPLHVIESAKCGAHIATIPADVLDKMMKHPLTDIGIEKFLSDWKKASLSL